MIPKDKEDLILAIFLTILNTIFIKQFITIMVLPLSFICVFFMPFCLVALYSAVEKFTLVNWIFLSIVFVCQTWGIYFLKKKKSYGAILMIIALLLILFVTFGSGSEFEFSPIYHTCQEILKSNVTIQDFGLCR
jgi:hypothetical protein